MVRAIVFVSAVLAMVAYVSAAPGASLIDASNAGVLNGAAKGAKILDKGILNGDNRRLSFAYIYTYSGV